MHRDALLPLTALILGVGGCYLNNQIHATAIDSQTMLLYSGSPFLSALWLVTGLAVLLLAVGVFRGKEPKGSDEYLNTPGELARPMWLMGPILLSIGTGFTLYYCIQQLSQWSKGTAVTLPIVPLLGVLSGIVAAIGVLVMRKHLSLGDHSPILGTMSTLVAFAPLPWLLHCYQENTKNPVITIYVFQLLGLSTAAIALYLTATFFYGKSSPRLTAFLSLFGAYLLITAIVYDLAYYLVLTLMALAAILLGNAAVILKNMDNFTLNQQEGTE